MQAAQLVGPRQFAIVELDEPKPKPGEVLVRMQYLSVCGTDLHLYHNESEAPYPLRPGVPCHEAVGVVEDSRDERFKRGQRVIAVADSLLMESVAVRGDLLVPLPEGDFDPSLWVICQPVGTVMYAVKQIGSVLGSRVAIFGQGPIGLTFTDFMARHGADQVIVCDQVESRLEMARGLGATHTVNASREDVVERVKGITGGAMVDVSIEACGLPSTLHQVFQVIRRLGKVIVFGTLPHTGPFEFDWRMAYDRVPNVIVTSSTRAGERVSCVASCVSLVAQRRLDLSHLVTHRIPWADLGRAFELYSRGKDQCLKTVIVTDAADYQE